MNIRHSQQTRELAGHLYVATREHRSYLRHRGIPEPAAWPAIVELLQALAISGRQEPVQALLATAADPEPSLLTYAEAARIAGWSPRTIQRRVRDGALPTVGQRIPRAALMTYLAGQPD